MQLDEQELRDKLTSEQYRVLREKGTEAPYTGSLLYNDAAGRYACAVCGNVVFDSMTKFDSHCGWPSFYDAKKNAVVLNKDRSQDMIRTEVTCSRCSSHLGHVFSDVPDQPTGQRYCINSVALNFKAEK